MKILKPLDPYQKMLPPKYQAQLDQSYEKLLVSAMSNSNILEKFDSSTQRSRSHLTNAEHHAMKANHVLLANKISELPHHYFKLVEKIEKSMTSKVPDATPAALKSFGQTKSNSGALLNRPE